MRQKAETIQRLATQTASSSTLADRVITAMDTDRQISFQLDDSEFDPLDHIYAVPFIPTGNYVDPYPL
jgi:hypothetical protein